MAVAKMFVLVPLLILVARKYFLGRVPWVQSFCIVVGPIRYKWFDHILWWGLEWFQWISIMLPTHGQAKREFCRCGPEVRRLRLDTRCHQHHPRKGIAIRIIQVRKITFQSIVCRTTWPAWLGNWLIKMFGLVSSMTTRPSPTNGDGSIIPQSMKT